MMGQGRLCLFKKAYGIGTLGALQSPGPLPLKLKGPRITLSPLRSSPAKIEEATAATTTQAPSTCHASQPLRVTSFSEHLEDLTNDPRKESLTLYVSAQSGSCVILILLKEEWDWNKLLIWPYRQNTFL